MNLLFGWHHSTSFGELFYCYFRKWCSSANQIAFHDYRKRMQTHRFSRILHLAGTRALLLAAPGCSWRLLGAHWTPIATPSGSWRFWQSLAAPGCSGESWRLLATPGGSWQLLSWKLMAVPGAPGGSWRRCRRLREAPGGSWKLLPAPSVSWQLLGAPGGSWDPLAARGCPWRLLAVVGAPGSSKRFLASPGRSWQLLAAYLPQVLVY